MNVLNNNTKGLNPLHDIAKRFNTFLLYLYMLACIILPISFNSAYAETIITNTATVNYSSNGTNHQLSDSAQFTKDTVVVPTDTMTLTKQADTTTASTGDTIRYTLTVANPNNHILNNVHIQDTLAAGLNYQAGTVKLNNVALDSSQITYTNNQLTLNLGNMPENSTWTVNYDAQVSTSGTIINNAVAISDSASSPQVQATVNVTLRTPSTIKFLKINGSGTNQIIQPTAYNDNQSGGKSWQEVDTVTLADGSTVNLPNSQPLIDAPQYTLLEPIVIEVTDLDQNLDATVIETIIITVTVPGTNDTEELLLRETTPNSGIFRGILRTTSNSATTQDGLLSLKEGSQISVNYRDEEDNTDSSVTAALVVPSTNVVLTKTVDKDAVTLGESVHYTLELHNNKNFPLANLKVLDTLPRGFRYEVNTATLNGTTAISNNAVTVNGRKLHFTLGNLPVGTTWTIEYQAKVGVGAKIGKATNKAYITGDNFKSNTAHASVMIKDDLMRDKSILTGRVYIGCKTGKGAKVLKDTRLFTETGRSVLSDEEGFWHMEGMNSGKHVLQIDTLSLSRTDKSYEPILCQGTTHKAGRAHSQFVDLQAGSLWHVNFHVKEIHSNKQGEKLAHPPTSGEFDSNRSNIEIDPKKKYGKEFIKTAKEGFEILWPKNNYVPAVASTKIVIKSVPTHKVELFLNGSKVSPLNYDGSNTNKARTVVIRRWVGVDIDVKNRTNKLLVIIKDKLGKEIARETRIIHFSGEPASIKFLPEESTLIADGKTTPVIAVRVKDAEGFPMRANTHGYFSLSKGNFSIKTLSSTIDTLNLNESIAGSHKYYIKKNNGVALIELNPTTQSGEVELTFKFNDTETTTKITNTDKTIKAWLKPQLRDWILVGIAEGTIAHNKLSGNMQALDDLSKSDAFSKRGRVAFYAKGRVKGKYLLTLAYDTHKKKQEVGAQLNGNIDPDAWYTVYADNSNNQYNAASSRKLYLKIEKENFYALFGDFNTNLNVTELAKYERTLNGIKSEYRGKRFSYNGFVSETSNAHHHKEIPGDGTSGMYHLSAGIIPNSEIIKIEVRDRFHSEKIIESRTLSRYQDYDIDYTAGTLFFKFPITGRDKNFNPQIIVVDYDSETDNNKVIVASGRVSVTTDDKKLDVGLSATHIGNNQAKSDYLIALDARYKFSKDTELHAEVAQSNTAKSQHKSVSAEIIEIQKRFSQLEGRIYYRKTDKDFGIDSQASDTGTKKVGAELNYKVNNKTNIKAEVSQQDNLSNNNQRRLIEVGISHKHKQLEVSAGIRNSKEKLLDNTGSQQTLNSDTALVGARYTTKSGKVSYRASMEENLKNTRNTSERSPNRKLFGVDVKIKEGTTLFVEHELTDNLDVETQNTRVGVSQSLWKGAKAKTTYTHERTDQGQRDYATLGLSQRIKVSKNLNADISIDHAKTINGTQKHFNNNEPAVQGSQRDDYTAFSVGIGSQVKDWSWSGRFEIRDGDINDKVNLNIGLVHHLKNGRQVSAKYSYLKSEDNKGNLKKGSKLSIGTAWHPKEKDFVFFSRLDLIDDSSISVGLNDTTTHTQKLIHNLHYSRKINDKTRLSLHHGIKHVITNNENNKNKSTVDTATIALRRDINKKWDIGVSAGYLHDWSSNSSETMAGVSIGVTPAKNVRLELGYNFEGFDDDDFDDSNYKRQGAFLNFSYKFDQSLFSRRKRLPKVPDKSSIMK